MSEKFCKDDKNLPLDTACLKVFNQNDDSVTLYSIVDECYQCDALKWTDLGANTTATLRVSTKYPLRIHYTKNNDEFCHIKHSFQQYSQYGWNLTQNNSCSSIYTITESFNPYLPIIAAVLVYVVIFIISITYCRVFEKVKSYINNIRGTENEDVNSTQRIVENESIVQEVSKKKTRVQALDAFRGIAVLLMIFVNNGGGDYTFFEHSPWNGITVADLVLPWFAWITGFALYRTLHTKLRLSTSKKRIIYVSLKRSVKLIALGLMINSLNYKKGIALSSLRFPGILQLLGISYFVCTLIEISFSNGQRNTEFGRFSVLGDILNSWVQWLVIIFITIGRTLLVYLVAAPDCPKGYIGPGGYHMHGSYNQCTGGIIGYIDRYVFANHVYNHTSNPVYGTILAHDPEGLMNTIGAVLIVFLGLQASKIFIHNHNSSIRMIVWCVVTGLIAGILCNFSKESGVIPMNKKMMSLSYVLFTSSTAFLMWAILYFIIDNKKFWSGAPFIYAGTNPIVLYVGHYLTHNVFPWSWRITGVPTHSKSLTMNLWTTTLWAIISYYFYVNEIFITV